MSLITESLTPDEVAAQERLGPDGYNERPNAPTNTLGFGRGGNQPPISLFIRAIRDIALFGQGIVRTVTFALSDIERLHDEAQIAAIIVEGGPVSSVTIGGVTQTGAVTIDLSAISDALNAQLAAVQAAQTALAAAQAGLLDDGITYNRAFGD